MLFGSESLQGVYFWSGKMESTKKKAMQGVEDILLQSLLPGIQSLNGRIIFLFIIIIRRFQAE